MGINLSTPRIPSELQPRIMVFGVGGAGGNAVNNMIRSNLEGVECIVANTDAQALAQSLAERRIQLGLSITQGLGSGSRPEIGRAAAEEGMQEIIDHLQGCHMAFVTAGMGGGTGTGAAPVIARLAREQGVLTVAVVTKPFQFEGAHRMKVADEGLNELQEQVDTLIVIPNQNLFRVADENTTFTDAFKLADEVLYAGVRGVTDLMTMPGLINLDFADIRTVMGEMGKAMMGAGEAEGDGRAIKAAESAIANPLLDDVSLRGAKGVLINITGGNDMTLYEVDESANRIREEVDADANIIFGSTFDEAIQGRIRVSIFATGINGHHAVAPPQPNRVRVLDERSRRPALPRTELIAEDEDPEEIFGLGPKLDDKPEIKTASQFDPDPIREPIREPFIERVAESVREPIDLPAPKPIVAQATPVAAPIEVPAPMAVEPRAALVPQPALAPMFAPRPTSAPTSALSQTSAPVVLPPAAQAAPMQAPSFDQAVTPEPAPSVSFAPAPAPMPVIDRRQDPVFAAPSAEEAPKPIVAASPTAPASVPPRPLVREVPRPESAGPSDAKPRTRARSRLLGLLIDNSMSDEDRPAGIDARAADAPRVIEAPGASTSAGQAETPQVAEPTAASALPIEAGPVPEPREEAELLAIPAFLRRQAN
ncbi:MAG TPA: cell division protein FtsZ [Alphaproteobacteria bacterium]|nr:cell division protein FtsZ [Alphaproteobacteria bacterium]